MQTITDCFDPLLEDALGTFVPTYDATSSECSDVPHSGVAREAHDPLPMPATDAASAIHGSPQSLQHTALQVHLMCFVTACNVYCRNEITRAGRCVFFLI